MQRAIKTGIFFILLLAKSSCAVTLQIYGMIVLDPPPVYDNKCIINDDSLMEINFGTIITDKIDGVNYQVDIPLTIDCSGVDERYIASRLPKISYVGITSNFSTGAIVTTIQGLGIELKKDGKVFSPSGRSIDLDINTPPKLQAVPVKDPSQTLKEGNFEAFAILVAEYL